MLRAVLDTDVIVSGTLVPEGHSGQILKTWRDGRFLLIISEDLIEEVKDVLNRPRIRDKYRHLTQATIGRLVNLVMGQETVTRPQHQTAHRASWQELAAFGILER